MHINDQQHADFYARLAALDNAGIPTAKALITAAHKNPALKKRCLNAAELVGKGYQLAEALKHYKLLQNQDFQIILAAQESGQLGNVLDKLARHYLAKAINIRTFQRQILLPILILILAIFIKPLPALILGETNINLYLQQTLFVLIKLCLIGYVIYSIPSILRTRSFAKSGLTTLVDRLILWLPIFGKKNITRGVRDFYATLALMLEAGVPIFQALPYSISVVKNNIIKKSLSRTSNLIVSGIPFEIALSKNRFLSPISVQFAKTGSCSGTLSVILDHYARLADTQIRQFDQQVASWAPKLIYFAILIWISSGIVGGSADLFRLH